LPTERRPLRGALIGIGGVARQSHYPAYVGATDVARRLQLVASVDGAAAVPNIPGLPRVPDAAGLAAFEPIEFIDICTPTASHAALALWGLDRGWHVLCEKPVATTRADAERVADAARRAGRVVVPCHQYRFNPAWLQLREWLDAGRIGRWHLAEFRTYRLHADQGAAAETDGAPWRGTRAEGGGGVLLDHGTHLLYLLDDVAGPPSRVQAWTGQLRHHAYDVEDTAQVLLEYPGDRIATIFVTWAAQRRETVIRFVGERGSIAWVGGELLLDADDGAVRMDFTAALDKAAYKDWFARLFGVFADAVDRGDAEPHLREIAAVAEVLERAYASAARSSAPPVGVP